MKNIQNGDLFEYKKTFTAKNLSKRIDVIYLQQLFNCSFLKDRWHPNSISALEELLLEQQPYREEDFLGHIVQLKTSSFVLIEYIVKTLKRYFAIFINPINALTILFSKHHEVLNNEDFKEWPRIIAVPDLDDKSLHPVWRNKYRGRLHIPLVIQNAGTKPELTFMHHDMNSDLNLSDFLVFFTKK